MTRDEVLQAIRAHLADELELDPGRIDEATHFKRDLDADSLDLYTLVQELEDSYGVTMSDEEAARIQTVGAAIDFVLEQAPDREPRP
jgi:acyl carrier protein